MFTHCLLEELQKKRKEEKFAILDVFTPIAKNVTERAKEKYNHTQTPTLNSYLKGNVYIPTFRKPLQVNLQVLDVPKYPELSSAAFLIPELQLEDKQQEQIVNEMIDLVNLFYYGFIWAMVVLSALKFVKL